MTVLVNNGNGTFATKIDFAAGDAPTSVAAADLNADGQPDLAVADFFSNTVSLLFNTCVAQ